MAPPLRIPEAIIDAMIAHARELDPYECCGMLGGKDNTVTNLYRVKNIVSLEGTETLSSFDEAKIGHLQRLSPSKRAEIAFVMDMEDFSKVKKDLRAQGLDLLVVYHSHPQSPAHPSVTDITIAADFEDLWGKIGLSVPRYLIISLEQKSAPYFRAFWIKDKQVTPATVETI